jgi:hypothetical protein
MAILAIGTTLLIILSYLLEDKEKSNPGKYLTPKSRKQWQILQEERRKKYQPIRKKDKLAVDHRLSGPLLFYAIPAIFCIILIALMPEVEPPLTISIIFSMIFLALALISLQQKRIIDDTPTLKTMGVFIGITELKGTAESENPLTSYLTQTKCVQYSWSIMEQLETGDWTTVAHGQESPPFYLMDDTGSIKIDPENALLISHTALNKIVDHNDSHYNNTGSLRITNLNRLRHFKETLIPLHSPIYVIGHARERSDKVAAEIAYDEDEPLYVISTKGEKQASSEFKNRFLILTTIGFLISIIFPRLSESYYMLYPPSYQKYLAETNPLLLIIPALIFIIAIIPGWSLLIYNSLANLRNNVDQAWSMIDIQLNRRNDLIPNIVEIIEGYRVHEEEIQTQTAILLTQTMNHEKQIGVNTLIQSIAETYPELKTGQQFLELQRTLEETEQRIALARDYYNQQTRFYNTRLEVIPDTYVARLSGLKPRQYWDAENFQRALEEINLVS